MTGESRWAAVCDRIAVWLALFAFLMREAIPSATAGHGHNLFIHLLFWIALTLWFAGRAAGGGGRYRFCGFEYALLAFAIIALCSALRASYKLTAIDHAFSFLSLSLFLILCVQLMSPRTLEHVLLATLVALSGYALLQYFVLFPMIQPQAAGVGSVEMARRIGSKEVFASLGGPNQLAGFLAMLLPLALGSLIDAREFAVRGSALVLGLGALAFTQSKGGWASLAAGGITMAALALTRSRGRTALVWAGGGTVGLALLLLAGTPLLSFLARHSHSVHVRAVYWRATGPIVGSRPVLGVGLDNWQEYYFETKSDVQQETVKAHDDYLQILAETGVLGFLALGAILALGLRKALSRKAAPAPEPSPPSAWLVAGSVGALLLIGILSAQEPDGRPDWIGRGILLVLTLLWLGSWMLLRRSRPPSAPTWTRIGAAGGLVALMVHMTVDFQLYQFGVAVALFAVLALVTLLRGGGSEVRLPRGVCIGATAVLAGITAPLLLMVVPRALAADGELEEVRDAVYRLERTAEPNPTRVLSDALRVSESAQAHDPFDPAADELYARLKYHEWRMAQNVHADRELEVIEGTMLQALDNAITLRPRSSPLWDEKAQAQLFFRRHYLKTAKDSELARAKAAEYLRLAVESQRRAYELYPTISRNAYLLARVLEMANDPEALKYYREAMRLSDRAGLELENLDRLKLSPLARARTFRALGKPFQAHDELEAELRKAIRGLPPDQARAGLERYVKMSSDELEEGMAPVLKDVVDAIMRDLK